MNRSGFGKISARIVGAFAVAIILFFVCFIVAEAWHDCDGEDCPICACIQQCEQLLNRFAGGEPARVFCEILVWFCALKAVFYSVDIIQTTLVSRRVRLND